MKEAANRGGGPKRTTALKHCAGGPAAFPREHAPGLTSQQGWRLIRPANDDDAVTSV
jgi:hypothetical protein